MNLLLVAVAFASLGQAGQAGNSELGTAELTQANRALPDGPAAAGSGAEADRRVCRRITMSGSHRYRRVCLTAEQWRQQQD